MKAPKSPIPSSVPTNFALTALVCLGLIVGICMADTPQTDADKKATIDAMYTGYKKEFPDVTDITPQKAMALQNQDQVVFVDIRKPAEMEVSMLPGAISQSVFLSNPSGYADKTIVAYCTISYRSGQLAKELADQGVAILNLQGGLLAWVHEGGKIYDSNGETHRLHVFSKKWDLAPAGYETITFGWLDRLFSRAFGSVSG